MDAQLTEHTVVVVLNGPDVELRVDDRPRPAAPTDGEELDARITLRLPPSLKQMVERVASGDGESVNSWVVDALSQRARRGTAPGRHVTEEFDL